jgi:hypothetical protein
MMAVGVARPKAQGQAMMSTATNVRTAYVSAGSGPKPHHRKKANVAIPKTDGTKILAI